MTFYTRELKYDFDALQNNENNQAISYSKQLFSKRPHVVDISDQLEALFGPDGEYPIHNVMVFSEHEEVKSERYGISYYRIIFHIDNGLPNWFGSAIIKITDLIRSLSSCNANENSCPPGKLQLIPYNDIVPGHIGYIDLIMEEHTSAEEKVECDQRVADLIRFFEPVARSNDALLQAEFLADYAEIGYLRTLQEIAKVCTRFKQNALVTTTQDFSDELTGLLLYTSFKFEIKPHLAGSNVYGLHSYMKVKPQDLMLDLLEELHHIWLPVDAPETYVITSSVSGTGESYSLEITARWRAL